jgi:site-specific DNA-methyltransferase (adenine-specific)
MRNVTLINDDCLRAMAKLPAASVDLILCDLPYGTTQNKWDSVIPLDTLWEQYWRIAKPNAAVVLTAQPPFDKQLGASCLEFMKYEWIWEKPKATGHLNCKKQPMKAHENVLVFYREQCCYNPQMGTGRAYSNNHKPGDSGSNYGNVAFSRVIDRTTRYPRSVIEFTHEMHPVHPTQKPVALMEYLIRTYTNPGALVLDNTMGSGTTGVAAVQSGRRFLGIERDPSYFQIASKRIAEARPPRPVLDLQAFRRVVEWNKRVREYAA